VSESCCDILLPSCMRQLIEVMLSLLGAVALAEFIAETMKLIRLDLRGNYIRTGGLMALMLSLKVNQTVTRIDLDGEPKKEAVSNIVIM